MSNYGKIKDTTGQTVSGYNPVDNIQRKANRTGETYENVGQNKAAHVYTTTGSSTEKARSAREAKRQAAANKAAPVKIYTDEEKKALEAKMLNKGCDLEKKAPADFSEDKKDKHERCVMDLKSEGKDVGSAHAICTSAMKKADDSYPDPPEECTSCGKEGTNLKAHADDLGEKTTWWDCPHCGTTGMAVHTSSKLYVAPKKGKKMKKGGEGQEDNGAHLIKSLEHKLNSIKTMIDNIEEKEVLIKNSLGQWSISSAFYKKDK